MTPRRIMAVGLLLSLSLFGAALAPALTPGIVQAASGATVSANPGATAVGGATVSPAIPDPVGYRLMQLKNYPAAAEHYRLVLARDPGNRQACMGLGSALWKMGKREEARNSFQSCLQRMPDQPDLYIARGLCEQQDGPDGYGPAEADFKKALALDPRNTSAHNQLGLIYQARGNHPDAIKEFRAAISGDPKFFAAYNNLAASLIATQQYREAISLIQQAIAMKPPLSGLYLYTNLGIAFLYAGKTDQAEAAFLMETALNPDHLDAHLNLGNIYALSRRYPQAIYEYQRALLAAPDYREALINLGAVYILTGNSQNALQYLQRAATLYPDAPLAHHYLALACQTLGDAQCARGEEQKAKALGYRPDSAPFPGQKSPP